MLITAMMLSFVIIAHNTTDTTKTDENTLITEKTLFETERIIDKYTDKAFDAIKGLAAALEIPAEFLYRVLVKQQIVYAFVYILTIVIGAIFLILFAKHLNLLKYDNNDFIEGTGKHVFLVIIFGAISIISLLIGLFNLNAIMIGLINPDYGAIKEIMEFMKPEAPK